MWTGADVAVIVAALVAIPVAFITTTRRKRTAEDDAEPAIMQGKPVSPTYADRLIAKLESDIQYARRERDRYHRERDAAHDVLRSHGLPIPPRPAD